MQILSSFSLILLFSAFFLFVNHLDNYLHQYRYLNQITRIPHKKPFLFSRHLFTEENTNTIRLLAYNEVFLPVLVDLNQSRINSSRYRLAGTFFAMNMKRDTVCPDDRRTAIIDDKQTGSQLIVQEGETIGGIKILKIYPEKILVNDGSGEYELVLNFTTTKPVLGKAESQSLQKKGNIQDKSNWLGGQRVGENSWVFNRNKLLDYYQQLMDDPERLLKVFDSLKPIYNENNNITGYRVGIEGEKEFFDAIGFKEGDVVRSVNTMKMTSRQRAEYFINEFIRNRVNAFLIEVERDGKTNKFLYHVR